MAFPKAGSRKIVVDNVSYLWRIRKRATYWQEFFKGSLNIAVTLEEAPRSLLILTVKGALHPKTWDRKGNDPVASVKPAEVANWIRGALKQGWDPSANGQFTLPVALAPETVAKAKN